MKPALIALNGVFLGLNLYFAITQGAWYSWGGAGLNVAMLAWTLTWKE